MLPGVAGNIVLTWNLAVNPSTRALQTTMSGARQAIGQESRFTDKELAARQLSMVVRRPVWDNILAEGRRRMMDDVERAMDDRSSGW